MNEMETKKKRPKTLFIGAVLLICVAGLGWSLWTSHQQQKELEKQLEMQMNNITRLEELDNSHPATVRRIMAEKFFAECDLFYRWRPDLRTPGQVLRSKEETDALCKKYINIVQE